MKQSPRSIVRRTLASLQSDLDALEANLDAAEARASEMELRYDRLTIDFGRIVEQERQLRKAFDHLVHRELGPALQAIADGKSPDLALVVSRAVQYGARALAKRQKKGTLP